MANTALGIGLIDSSNTYPSAWQFGSPFAVVRHYNLRISAYSISCGNFTCAGVLEILSSMKILDLYQYYGCKVETFVVAVLFIDLWHLQSIPEMDYLRGDRIHPMEYSFMPIFPSSGN